MCYFFEFAEFWNYIFLNKKNFKLITIILKDKKFENDIKLKC